MKMKENSSVNFIGDNTGDLIGDSEFLRHKKKTRSFLTSQLTGTKTYSLV